MKNQSSPLSNQFAATEWKHERLDSWKEVASFFRKEVRTVQLWEKSEGLPVRRQYHKKLGSVYAYRQELEAWWLARSARHGGFEREADLAQNHATQLRDGVDTVLLLESRASASAAMSVVPRLGESPLAQSESHPRSHPRIATFPLEVMHSPLDRGPVRQIVDNFAEGLREDLVFELSRIGLQPILLLLKALPSPGSASLSLVKSVAREFRAEAILTGSVRYSGNRLRVSMQLIRASDSLCLWSDRFDAALDDPLMAQAELAKRISQALPNVQSQLGNRQGLHLASGGGLASNACAMGFHSWQRRGRSSLFKALNYFQDAIELDPSCADAYAGLADTYVSLSYNHLMPAREAASKARAAVDTAVALDRKHRRDSIQVRNSRINLLINCSWDLAAAESECRELIDRGSMDGRTLQLYSSLMTCRGRHTDAISLALHANRLQPDSDLIHGQISLAYFYAGDYSNAMNFVSRTIELEPQFLMGYALQGRTQAELGNWDQAIKSFRSGLAMSPDSTSLKALLAYACAGGGDASGANILLQELEDESHGECFPAYEVSAVHAMLNQENEALKNMNRAYGSRDMKTIFVKHDPRFAHMRSSTGFQDVASAVYPDWIMPSAV
jgi:TolB-like protein/Tfp pilus assembly protein PilF